MGRAEWEGWVETVPSTERHRMRTDIRGRDRQKKKDMKRSAERIGKQGDRGTERDTDVPDEVS